MSALSKEEIEEAAAEVGISPAELKNALMEREGTLPARLTSAVAETAIVEYTSEARLSSTTQEAVSIAKEAIERRAGARGHMQGPNAANIVDETRMVTYRIHAEPDGAGGSLVSIEVDRASVNARANLSALALLASSAIGSGALLVIGSAIQAAAAMAMCCFFFVPLTIWMRRRANAAAQEAARLATQAMLDAEDQAGVS